MTNYEKNKEKIKQLADLGMTFSVNRSTKEVDLCATAICDQCLFIKNCDTERFIWAYEEYIQPEVDWSKVPVDTKILVSDNEGLTWFPRYFAKYENNLVYTWCNGRTSFSIGNSNDHFTSWKYAKLAEVN